MLDIICAIEGLLTITLGSAYLVFITVTSIKGEYSSTKNVKCRIAFSAVLCFLFVLRTIFAIALSKPGFSIGCDIFCVLLWIFNVVLGILALKDATDNEAPSIEICVVITPCFDNEENTENEEQTEKENE